MARILVTGASGFIGSHVVANLAEKGHEVIATGRSQNDLSKLGNNIAQISIADLCLDVLEPMTDGCEFVVHCAALSSPWDSAENFLHANVTATERLLAASQRTGVRRFVHMGSPSIYFRFADQYRVDESFKAPQKWITEYAKSKWESELRVQAASRSGMETLVLRPRAVFGERDRAILPRLLAIAEKGWFPLIHRGNAIIDITYVANVAHSVSDSLIADIVADGRAYNITNGEPISVYELITRLFLALDKDVRLIPVPRKIALGVAGVAECITKLRSGMPEPFLTRYGVGVIGYSQTLDISRARQELKYSPTVSINDGIARFAKWWRQNATA